MSSSIIDSDAPTSTTNSTDATASVITSGGSSGGVSSSLYLFTFLITIVVLGLIAASLLLRAYYVRRQFQRAVDEAIASGRPLPEEAAIALGLFIRPGGGGGSGGAGAFGFGRGKAEKEVGPMPGLNEVLLTRDWDWDHKEKHEVNESVNEKHTEQVTVEVTRASPNDWEGITPVSMVTFPKGDPPPPPPLSIPVMPQARGPRILRPFLAPRITEEAIAAAARPVLDAERANLTAPILPSYQIPEQGEECVLGVMIALPVEPGKGAEKWDRQEDEEGDVPEVCLGVMKFDIGDGHGHGHGHGDWRGQAE